MVELKDMQYEYALLSARAALARGDPTLLSAGGAFFLSLDAGTLFHVGFAELALPAPSIVLRLAQSNRFNTAMATARSLAVDMSDLFGHLTSRCLRLSRRPDAVM